MAAGGQKLRTVVRTTAVRAAHTSVKETKGFFTDFAKFINRGNVVDLAVALIVGAAFTAIITSLVADIFSPFISLATSQGSLSDKFFILRWGQNASIEYPSVAAAKADGAITLNWGNFAQTVINFFLVAFVVFIIVKLVSVVYRKKEVESTDLDCPECFEKVKMQAIRCKWCTAKICREPPKNVDTEASEAEFIS